MEMEIRVVKYGFRFYFRMVCQLKRVTHVTGINSEYLPGKHFLMWDFDDTELETVIEDLLLVQYLFQLPNIAILKTKDKGYHAYCFKSCDMNLARSIIGMTPHVDNHYLAAGTGRGYFTLRFLGGREPEHVMILPSDVPDDLVAEDINCMVEYTKAIK